MSYIIPLVNRWCLSKYIPGIAVSFTKRHSTSDHHGVLFNFTAFCQTQWNEKCDKKQIVSSQRDNYAAICENRQKSYVQSWEHDQCHILSNKRAPLPPPPGTTVQLTRDLLGCSCGWGETGSFVEPRGNQPGASGWPASLAAPPVTQHIVRQLKVVLHRTHSTVIYSRI